MSMAEDRVIARVGERSIVYDEVACDRDLAAQNPRWLRGMSVEEACIAYEKEQFRILIKRALVEAACKLLECAPTEEAVAAFRSPILRDEALLQKLAAETRKIPEAVRRVYQGEPIEAIYAEAIQPMKKSLDDFRRIVVAYKSLERVEKLLARDSAAAMRRHYEDQARYKAVKATVRKHVEATARAKNISIETAADDLLVLLAEKVSSVVIDDQFSIPPGREVFL
jgi:hypothetical protein